MDRFVFPDLEQVAAAVAERVRGAAEQAIGVRGRFDLSLTGGEIMREIYARCAEEAVDWERVHVYWGDERAVAPDHEDSNHRLAREALLDPAGIPSANVHRMPGELDDLEEAARRYEETLRRELGATPVLDVVHLGVGPDGHVCSLFPGHDLLGVRDRLVLPVLDSPRPPPRRLTITLPVIWRAREVWFIVAGEDTAPVVREAVADPTSTLPVALAARGAQRVTWFLDADAARELEAPRPGEAPPPPA
jgi:6-phosphogluconolactonase